MPLQMLAEMCAAPTAEAAAQQRLIEPGDIRMSEIVGALSVALDITQGHPEGHCMRSAMIGMRLAEHAAACRLPIARRCSMPCC